MYRLARTSTVTLCISLALANCARTPHDDGKGAPTQVAQLLQLRSQIPDLLGRDQDGNTQRLRAYLGRPLLVYFYPKDGTPGCTKEACAFRDVWKKFEAEGIQIVGVSRDDTSSHAKFAKEHRIPFPLIADADARWAGAFGVPLRDNGKFSRVSFLFDRSGKLSHLYENVDPGVHAEEVLKDTRNL
jgi:peroxiredoxin Q/BCP